MHGKATSPLPACLHDSELKELVFFLVARRTRISISTKTSYMHWGVAVRLPKSNVVAHVSIEGHGEPLRKAQITFGEHYAIVFELNVNKENRIESQAIIFCREDWEKAYYLGTTTNSLENLAVAINTHSLNQKNTSYLVETAKGLIYVLIGISI